MGYGYTGRILKVNLSTQTCTVEEPPDSFYRTYLGGWGFIAYYLLREVPALADPLGPDNLLIFAPGVATGTALAGSGRHAVGAKSPLTGGFGAAESGGFWGTELKRAGYDAIVVKGVADTPTYLWIHDEEAQLRPADHLWGKKTKEAQELLWEELGDRRTRITQIGPGGENLVRYACIANELRDMAGRGGLGAVMGSRDSRQSPSAEPIGLQRPTWSRSSRSIDGCEIITGTWPGISLISAPGRLWST